MSANECFNLLLKDVFWAMRGELKADRELGGLTEEEEGWDTNMEDIGPDFDLTSRYSKSICQVKRPLSFQNYLGVRRWMETLVDKEHKEELRMLVDGLLLDGHFAPVEKEQPKPKKEQKESKPKKQSVKDSK